MAHTQGPWTVKEDGHDMDGCQLLSVFAGSHFVCRAYWTDDEIGNIAEGAVQANARLIAAAPELLEACEDALELLRESDRRASSRIRTLTAAIAKAKGGEG